MFDVLEFVIVIKSVQWKPGRSTETEGQTDMTNLTVVFRNFANVPNNNFFNSELQCPLFHFYLINETAD